MKACPRCGLRYPATAITCFVDGAPLEDIRDARIGSTVAGAYVIEALIAEGAMARVYQAHHQLVRRPCAVKVMSQDFASDPAIRERFHRAAKSAQKLAHPNIVEIFDEGEMPDGCLYLVMELLEGHTLAEELRLGKITVQRGLPIAIQMARGLARAHDLEVIHRDLNPANIFLARDTNLDERVVLLDFGVARNSLEPLLTGLGEVFGTPPYTAPEQIAGNEAGPAADLYAVGIIVFEMLTGSVPFQAANATGFLVKHLHETAPLLRDSDPSVPESLEQLVSHLLAKDPADRPVDAHRLHADLLQIANALGLRMVAEPASGIGSSQPAAALPAANLDRWRRRVEVFDKMLARLRSSGSWRSGYMSLGHTLADIATRVARFSELGEERVGYQAELEDVEVRGREGRLRFGRAVDALGVDASHARDDARACAALLAETASALEQCRRVVLLSLRDLLYWEGRSGFVQPYPELAAAYRQMAEAVEVWERTFRQHQQAEEQMTSKRTYVADLEFQIEELRAALANFQQGIENEQHQLKALMSEQANLAERIEGELLELAVKFCVPLRGRSELQALFRELEE